jgi:hypothetical protein
MDGVGAGTKNGQAVTGAKYSGGTVCMYKVGIIIFKFRSLFKKINSRQRMTIPIGDEGNVFNSSVFYSITIKNWNLA